VRYSDLLVENREIVIRYTPPLFNAPQGVTPLEFREDVDAGKTRMIVLSYDEKKTMTICKAVFI